MAALKVLLIALGVVLVTLGSILSSPGIGGRLLYSSTASALVFPDQDRSCSDFPPSACQCKYTYIFYTDEYFTESIYGSIWLRCFDTPPRSFDVRYRKCSAWHHYLPGITQPRIGIFPFFLQATGVCSFLLSIFLMVARRTPSSNRENFYLYCFVGSICVASPVASISRGLQVWEYVVIGICVVIICEMVAFVLLETLMLLALPTVRCRDEISPRPLASTFTFSCHSPAQGTRGLPPATPVPDAEAPAPQSDARSEIPTQSGPRATSTAAWLTLLLAQALSLIKSVAWVLCISAAGVACFGVGIWLLGAIDVRQLLFPRQAEGTLRIDVLDSSWRYLRVYCSYTVGEYTVRITTDLDAPSPPACRYRTTIVRYSAFNPMFSYVPGCIEPKYNKVYVTAFGAFFIICSVIVALWTVFNRGAWWTDNILAGVKALPATFRQFCEFREDRRRTRSRLVRADTEMESMDLKKKTDDVKMMEEMDSTSSTELSNISTDDLPKIPMVAVRLVGGGGEEAATHND